MGVELSSGRRAALRTLRRVSRGQRIDRALPQEAAGLSPAERRWVQELAYGVCRLRGRLDYLLELHTHRGLSTLSPRLLDVLRMGGYQLLNMGSVPPYAAVSQTVEQARQVGGGGAAALANGVLRALAREGGDPSRFPSLAEEPLRHLSTWGSHPEWLVQRWLQRWSVDEVRRLVEENNRVPDLYVRPFGISEEEAVGRLAAQGIVAERVGGATGCVRLSGGTMPETVLAIVPGVIQDPGAALVTVYAAFPDEGLLVDLCAAPGGKALALAGSAAYVVAADRSGPRLGVLKENARRVGRTLSLVQASADRPPFRSADGVLLDVPCTGTGTLRRHPDARWRLDGGSMARMAEVQSRFLDGAADIISPGGLLVYSTCTLEPEENEIQIEVFLDRHQDYVLEPGKTVPRESMAADGTLFVLPQSTGFDGAFAARLRRV